MCLCVVQYMYSMTIEYLWTVRVCVCECVVDPHSVFPPLSFTVSISCVCNLHFYSPALSATLPPPPHESPHGVAWSSASSPPPPLMCAQCGVAKGVLTSPPRPQSAAPLWGVDFHLRRCALDCRWHCQPDDQVSSLIWRAPYQSSFLVWVSAAWRNWLRRLLKMYFFRTKAFRKYDFIKFPAITESF